MSRASRFLALSLLSVLILPSVATAADEVPFTASGTAVITGVTHLPGGLTQVNFGTAGSATHLGEFTGPLTRIQDHQGTFGSTAVIVGANGKDSVFFSVSGNFEGGKGNSCVVTSTGTYTVTGGAGAFANAARCHPPRKRAAMPPEGVGHPRLKSGLAGRTGSFRAGESSISTCR